VFEGDELKVPSEKKNLITDVMTHILRNSLDHGIEEDKTRLTKNKPETGKITINASITNEELTLVVEDDGQGLNIRHLEEKGLEEKIISNDASDESIANIIFHSGISTAVKVSDISGRGVGMDAVKSFLEKKGGGVKIEFTDEKNSDGFRPFKFIIKLAV
jgi:chemotaxis protein histidine kinase CheA